MAQIKSALLFKMWKVFVLFSDLFAIVVAIACRDV